VPEIQPFTAVRYRVSDAELPRVLAPPYDVIPPACQAELYARDPRNVVRVVLNRSEGEAAYREAGETYRDWLAQGVLAAEKEPALFVLEQRFTLEGRSLARWGLLARVRAEDLESGSILPHEQTRKGPREDRYRVLRATGANFSPIFMMFPDTGGRFAAVAARAATADPIATYTDDAQVGHRLWRLSDPAVVAELQGHLRSVKAYIADGHHRYATALRYRDESGPDGAWTFGYFTPLDAPGLVVLPYHRVLSEGPSLAAAREALQSGFLVNDAPDAAAAARDAEHSTMPYAFGLAEPGGGALVAEALPEAEDLLPRDAHRSLQALDTYFLHEIVLPGVLRVPAEAVGYVHSLAEAQEALTRRSCRLAVLMRPTRVRQIVEVAEARQSMPAKSTFFHPKVPSGLVIHPLAVAPA
jgi:uncharacterized protein (DUF1015 family)